MRVRAPERNDPVLVLNLVVEMVVNVFWRTVTLRVFLFQVVALFAVVHVFDRVTVILRWWIRGRSRLFKRLFHNASVSRLFHGLYHVIWVSTTSFCDRHHYVKAFQIVNESMTLDLFTFSRIGLKHPFSDQFVHDILRNREPVPN